MNGLGGSQPRGARGFGGHKVKFNEIFKRETNVNKECMCTPSEN